MNKLMLTLAMSTISVLADDVMVNTGTYQGTIWGNAAMWRSGTVPNGAGTIIDTGEVSDGFYIKMDATNRVIGGITSTFGVMPQKEDQRLYIIPYGYEFREYVEPQINADKSYLYVTSSITFNNNGNGAFIRIDDAFPSDDTTFHSAFRYYFDVPVVLEDSLSITHNANHPNTYGLAKFSSYLGAEGVFFGGKVSGSKNITSSFKLLTMGTMFNCDKNDFTGNITAESGIVRAKDTSNLPREGTPLGRNNHIYATNGTGRVDLGGFITGEGQTLYLAGKNESFNNVNGVLFSTFAKPGEYSKWCGNVVLEGDTWIGGTLGGDSYPRNQYPVDTHGGIEISGVISDGGDTPRAVHSVNKGGNVFSGDNTFSGGFI